MLRQRVITACALVALLAIVLLWLPYHGYVIAVTTIMTLAAWEWANLAGVSRVVWRLAYAAFVAVLLVSLHILHLEQQRTASLLILAMAVLGWLWALFAIGRYPDGTRWYHRRYLLPAGIWLLVPAWLGLLVLKPLVINSGLIWLVIAIIAAADIGAYFAGRRFGRHKLAVHVSPGKTWEGFWGGVCAAAVLALALGLYPGLVHLPLLTWVGLAMLVAVASVLGDLFESMIKRQRGIKDSSNILPGHGGVLDRIDGWTAAIPLFALLYLLWAGS